MKIVKCFLDTETTGIDPQNNGITQIAGIIESGDRADSFNLLCRPFPQDDIELEALAIHHKTRDEVLAYPEPKEAHRQLMELFGSFVNKFDRNDKMFLYGYNVKFDDEFLRAWFKKLNDAYYGSWFHVPAICVMSLAAEYLAPVRHEMGRFRQGDVASKLGITFEESELHDALNDVKICREIYRIVAQKNEVRCG